VFASLLKCYLCCGCGDQYLRPDVVPADVVARERDIAKEQATASGTADATHADRQTAYPCLWSCCDRG
jgi:hypothetical protein